VQILAFHILKGFKKMIIELVFGMILGLSFVAASENNYLKSIYYNPPQP
jgi:hypothetical protein